MSAITLSKTPSPLQLQPSSGKPGSNHLAGQVGSRSNADIDLKLETSNSSITLQPAPLAEAIRP
jgi:hypothetical protein